VGIEGDKRGGGGAVMNRSGGGGRWRVIGEVLGGSRHRIF